MSQKVLIVIDMQNDFCVGSLANEEAVKIIPNIVTLVQEFHKNGGRVIFTKDTHHKESYMNSPEGKKLPVLHCIDGTWGWEIVKELVDVMEENDTIICKPTFGYQGWFDELGPKDEVYMCGTCTDICVVSNALAIKTTLPEVEVHVAANACAGLTPEKHEAALTVMESCQCDVNDYTDIQGVPLNGLYIPLIFKHKE